MRVKYFCFTILLALSSQLSFSQVTYQERDPRTQQMIQETNWLPLMFLKNDILNFKLKTVGDEAYLLVYATGDTSLLRRELPLLKVEFEGNRTITLKPTKEFKERRIVRPNQFKLAVDRAVIINTYPLDNETAQHLAKYRITAVKFPLGSNQLVLFSKFRKSDTKAVLKASKALFDITSY